MAWISRTQAKAYLRKNAAVTADDSLIDEFIPAACAQIEDLVGHVDQVSVAETARAAFVPNAHPQRRYYSSFRDGWMVSLREAPVASVTSVSLLSEVGGTSSAVAPEDLSTGVRGWSLIDTVVMLPGPGAYSIAYRAGFSVVPDNYVLAALELVLHHWRRSQLNAAGGRGPGADDQSMIVPRYASALPYSVRELLGIYGNVVNDYPVIA